MFSDQVTADVNAKCGTGSRWWCSRGDRSQVAGARVVRSSTAIDANGYMPAVPQRYLVGGSSATAARCTTAHKNR